MAQFILSPCTASDLPAMVEVYIRAFSPTTMYAMLFPSSTCSTSSVSSWLYPRFEKVATQGHAEVQVLKVTEAATGRLVAWMRWGCPVTLTAEEKGRRDQVKASEEAEREELLRRTGSDGRWPEGANVEACKDYFSAMDAMREKYMNTEEHYIIYLLATDAAYQRRGLGGMLLGHVIALAEAEGKKIYLEATKVGHPLYQKLGWRDVDLITVDCRKWGIDQSDYNWVMLREPQAKV